MAELQQRMAISGQLAPILTDDDEAAAGRLWDLSKAPLQHGDYELICAVTAISSPSSRN